MLIIALMAKSKPPTRASVHYLNAQKTERSSNLRLFAGLTLLAGVVFCAVLFWPVNDNGDASATVLDRPASFTCSVSTITDGDTLRCADGTKVRLHAVAAREKDETCSPGHPCPEASGAAATSKLTELTSGQILQCQQTGTSYDRVNAICRNRSNVEINCAMVESGMAVLWPKFNAQTPICQ